MSAPARHDVHQWAGTDPDHCIVCDVDWSDADLTCKPTAGHAVCDLINALDREQVEKLRDLLSQHLDYTSQAAK